MEILKKLQASNIKPGDKPIADGTVTGLWLHPGKIKGHGKWILRFVSPQTNKRRDMGLGTYPEVSIVDARKAALAARELIRNGRDPIDARKSDAVNSKREANALTFEKAARQVHADLKPGWKNAKQAAQWITTLETYVFPKIGNRKVDSLKVKDFADALQPIWLNKAETASRVKQRCNTVMDWCAAQELIGANPVGVVTKLLSHPDCPWPGWNPNADVSCNAVVIEFCEQGMSGGKCTGICKDRVFLGDQGLKF